MSLLKSVGGRSAPSKESRRTAGGVAGATVLPQVNLLPNEIVSARGIRSLRRLLGLVVVACVVAVVGAVVFASSLVSSAEDELALEQQRAERLLAEKITYAEVPLVLKRLSTTQDKLELAASTEIQWTERLDALMAVTPDGVTISSLAVANAGPVEAAPPAGDSFQTQGVGRLTFVADSVTRPDTVVWLEALESVDGFADARLTLSTRAGAGDQVSYSTTVTVEVLDSAYSNKFVPEENS